MSEALRRISVHAADGCGDTTVDLTLPTHVALAMLIPAIVDILCGHGYQAGSDIRDWQLSRLAGETLDESTTLSQNNIHDGDVLVLSTIDSSARASVIDDRPAPVVAATAAHGDRLPPIVTSAACLWAATVGAVSLGWAGVGGSGMFEVSAAILLAIAFAVVAVAGSRTHPDPVRCVTLCVVSTGCAAMAGFLVVPAGPAAPAYLLAASVAASTAVVLMRLTGCGAVVLTSIATGAAVSAIALACAVLWRLPTPSVGAVLATVALAALTVAPRLSVGLAGLAPTWSTSEDNGLDDSLHETDGLAERAERGHRMLTGLMFGAVGSAMLGTLLIAVGYLGARAPGPSEVAFSAVVGAVLSLRARSHIDPSRRTVLVAGGMASFTSAFVLTAMAVPAYAGWFGAAVIGSGMAALYPVTEPVRSPVAHRAVDVLEYLSLAAVVPLCCWVADVYGLARGLSLI